MSNRQLHGGTTLLAYFQTIVIYQQTFLKTMVIVEMDTLVKHIISICNQTLQKYGVHINPYIKCQTKNCISNEDLTLYSILNLYKGNNHLILFHHSIYLFVYL